MRFHRPRPLATRPSVSVVIPCYNYGHYLPDAVASALDQEGLDVDVLVVDDASSDGSAEVARSLAAADERVDVLVHEENAGHIRTYNDGLAKARGDYVVLLSADDLLPRDALSRAVALMEAHPRVGLVYGFPQGFTQGVPRDGGRLRSWSVWPGQQWLQMLAGRGGNTIMSPEVVLRREAWLEVGAYDERLPHAGDLAVWLQVALRWDIGRVNGPAQAFYRVHGQNMHLTTYSGELRDLGQRLLTYELVLGDARAAHVDAARLGDMARRAIAREAAGIGGPQSREAMDFARTLVPDVTAPRRIRGVERVRRSLEWRRWRRYGW